ncbi:MAG: SRPBCC family protein [Anaerolineales bacterium]
MFKFENGVTITKPVQEVFRYASNPENFPSWNYYVEDVRRLSESPLSAGSRFHQKRRQDEQVLEVTEYKPGQSITVRTVPPSKPELVRKMIFKSKKGSTELIDRWELDLGVPGVIEVVAKRRVRQAVRENLGKLKTLLEAGQVVLQDGRIMRLEGGHASS